MSQGRLTNLGFDNFLDQIETHVNHFFLETISIYLNIILILLIGFTAIYMLVIKYMTHGAFKQEELQTMLARLIFMIICLGINFLVGKYYLPRFYFNKVEKFLEYHNILVYNQDKLAWSIGKGCCFLRLCLKYPEAFMEIMLDQSEYNSIN